MRGPVILATLALMGCETTGSEPQTVVRLKEPVAVTPEHPIPAQCRAQGHPRWVRFRDDVTIKKFAEDVLRAKRRHFSGLSRVRACECLIIQQWGSTEDKARVPRHCRDERGEA